MEKLRKDAKDVKVIWKLRSTFKRLLKFEDRFQDTAIFVMRSNGPLMEMLGPE